MILWHITVDVNLGYLVRWYQPCYILNKHTFILVPYGNITYRTYVWVSCPVAMTQNSPPKKEKKRKNNLRETGLFDLQFQVIVHNQQESQKEQQLAIASQAHPQTRTRNPYSAKLPCFNAFTLGPSPENGTFQIHSKSSKLNEPNSEIPHINAHRPT